MLVCDSQTVKLYFLRNADTRSYSKSFTVLWRAGS